MKKAPALLLGLAMLFSLAACGSGTGSSDLPQKAAASEEQRYQQYVAMTPEEIVAGMTWEQKAAQMVQPAVYNVSKKDMQQNDYGSILSTTGCIDAAAWRTLVDRYQKAAIESEAGIPYLYGQDDEIGRAHV